MPHRILYLIGQLGVGGAERQLVYLATHLDRSQFEPIVCSLSDDISLAGDLHAAGVQLVVLPKRMSPDLTRLWRVVHVARQHRPALIHSYMFVANTWARTTGILCRIPVIVSERTAREDGNRFQGCVDRLLSPMTDLLVANSYAGGVIAVRSGKIAGDRLAVVHNGIPLREFRDASTGPKVREEFHVAPHEPLVGIVGRLTEVKDHATFFEAMALAARKVPNVRILCVGDGPLRNSLPERVTQLGLHNRTVFAGMRSDIPSIMDALDLLVLSSTREAFPNVLIEAMAAGRPVVATRVGDVERIVVHEKTGLLVPPREPAALAEAIVSLITNPHLAAEMGRCALIQIEREFTLDRMVHAMEHLYRSLLPGGVRVFHCEEVIGFSEGDVPRSP